MEREIFISRSMILLPQYFLYPYPPNKIKTFLKNIFCKLFCFMIIIYESKHDASFILLLEKHLEKSVSKHAEFYLVFKLSFLQPSNSFQKFIGITNYTYQMNKIISRNFFICLLLVFSLHFTTFTSCFSKKFTV